MGWLVGWMFLLAEIVVAPGGLLILGDVVSASLRQNLSAPSWVWAPVAAGGGLVIWWLVWRGVRLSTRASLVLGAFEVAVFLALAVTLIVQAGSHNTWQVFTFSFVPHGRGAIPLGILYAVFGIVGFEAAAPLGEEARNPKRTVPQAVVFSCLTISLLYLICYYAATVAYGPHRMTGFVHFGAGDPWSALARGAWGLGFVAVVIALVNSAIAGSNASAIATTRVGYAFARIGMLPRRFARLHPRTRTPTMAVHVQMLFALGYALVIGWVTGGPLNALVLQGTISTVAIVAIYIVTCVSCIVFYLRERRPEFRPLRHGLVPGVGAVVFVPVLLAAFGVNFGIGVPPLAYPANYAAYVLYGWFAVGLALLGYFLVRDRGKLDDTRRVFEEHDQQALSAAAGSTDGAD